MAGEVEGGAWGTLEAERRTQVEEEAVATDANAAGTENAY